MPEVGSLRSRVGFGNEVRREEQGKTHSQTADDRNTPGDRVTSEREQTVNRWHKAQAECAAGDLARQPIRSIVLQQPQVRIGHWQPRR